MIRLSINAIKAKSADRPAGYVDDVLSDVAKKDYQYIWLTGERYNELKRKYDPKIKFLESVANCEHRGRVARQVKCTLCGDRAKTANVYECLHFGGECTIDHYQSGQAERVCKRCEVFD